MLLIIDNYDSFVFNLARFFQKLGVETKVVRNDEVDCEAIRRLRPSAVAISPGPCTPNEAGVSLDLVRKFSHTTPILGVCLGHQAIAQAFGARVVRADRPVHGQSSTVLHGGTGLFDGVPNPLQACRYHSLVVSPDSLPAELDVTASTNEGTIMAIAHRQRPTFGVQFHPESILTDFGFQILQNFLSIAGIEAEASLAELQRDEQQIPVSRDWRPPDTPVTF